jgi:hypothetical protein
MALFRDFFIINYSKQNVNFKLLVEMYSEPETWYGFCNYSRLKRKSLCRLN